MEKEKKQNIQIILLSIIIVLLVGIMVYLLFFNKKDENKVIDSKENTTIESVKKERKISVNKADVNYVLDFDDIENRLIKKIDEQKKKAILSSCDCNGIDYDNVESMNCDNKELSSDSVKIVINKLFSSKKIEWVPTSRICADYTYLVEDSNFFLMEADDKSIILAGIDNDGYAFHYDGEDVRDFLKSLK